ncbi:LuxR family transcriptional regulator, maltose regulon positive regulatory protein [Marinobacter sp. es.048]|uniref:LuxR C-terminal-related transcriptional regulator n=1 Tax=Marinobacter sp. es.048 TaxID=1761795 RepID=UPI000B58D0F7|nr:LuxR C-terminal-related transcriptional regulator [Marinobacter sp. es.048]SNC74403.1 LuxR family transcriptional regulator, maltose regulon positive regulatory protein [Marinobacter sp. es.048]
MLLTTKFLRPTSDSRAVKRERLSDLLESLGPKRLNLVIAPAGFGKTTLVAQWCSRVSSPTAWLSLDEHDDEPRRFWQYVIGAFEQAGLTGAAELRKQLAHQSDKTFTEAITGLINILAQDGSSWALVLDDFHFIGNPAIHRQFAYFIDYLPPGVLVTLPSRTEPPLPLPRWRVRRWIEDIHPGLLAFSEEECRQFFRDTMGLGLDITDADIHAICRKTEGWVAAMQLSALSATFSGKDAAVSGNQINLDERYISDYVLSEVLEQQPRDIATFLLETACCPRLCASLCDSIRESNDSQEMLKTLLSQNLFLIPLDTRNEWFRYHDLFRDALLLRISHTEPEKATRLWQRTVKWLLAHGHVQEAIAQIVRQKDWPWLARVLAEHGNNLIHGGYHLPVLDWLDALPQELVNDNPQLQMLRIWGLFFANRVDTLEPLLSALEDLLDRQVADSHPDAEGALGLQSENSLMRSYLARTRSDDKRAADLTRQVLREIDHTRIPLKSVTYYGLGLDYYSKGELTEAEDALQSAVRYGQVEHKPSTVLSSGGLLAWIQYNRGDIDLALETCTDIRQWVDRHYSDPSQPRLISCWQNSTLCEIQRERNHPQLAATHLQPLLEHLERGTEPGQHVIIQYVRGHLAFSEGNLQDAIEALEDASLTGRKRREQIVFEPPASTALLARCYLAAGHPEQARASLDSRAGAEFTNPLHLEQSRISEARVLVALDQPERAQEILSALLNPAERNAHNRHLVEILLVYGEALAKQKRKNESEQMLTRAVNLAAEAGFMRLFAEESPELRALLLDLPALNVPGSWNGKVREMLLEQRELRQAHPETSEDSASNPAGRPAFKTDALPEPLSQRELEVLELIHAGHANKEIASKMKVAPATVKAHIRNLYGKLGVGRRTEALARARELGLLEP